MFVSERHHWCQALSFAIVFLEWYRLLPAVSVYVERKPGVIIGNEEGLYREYIRVTKVNWYRSVSKRSVG